MTGNRANLSVMTAASADGGHILVQADPATDASAPVTGLVEAVTGAMLTGWAIVPGREAACEVTVRDAAGQIVVQGTANQPRSDLAGLGFGRHDIGFRLPIVLPPTADALHVQADGVALPGSPLPIGPGVWDGVVTVQDGWAEGWVQERSAGKVLPVVTLFDQDDHELAAEPAWAGAGEGPFQPARFRIRLPQSAWRRPHIMVRAAIDRVVFAMTETALTLCGWLDHCDGDSWRGWLYSPEAPAQPFVIEVLRDGVVVATAIADLPRHDLRAAHPQGWCSGFDISAPRRSAAEALCTIGLRIADTESFLFDGPTVVGSRAALVAPARRAAERVLAMSLDPVVQSVVQRALAELIGQCRAAPDAPAQLRVQPSARPAARRFSVVIPIYRDVVVTQACIDSVLAHRDPATDAVVLVNDASPEPDMVPLLDGYAALPHVFVLTNGDNLGFVGSVNRALGFVAEGDVILLNSDTCVFAGSLAELWFAAHSRAEIGTATALSNNATIFSYPIPDQGSDLLDDIDWAGIAAAAQRTNHGRVIDVPTGHGFCMLITRAALDRVGAFDPAFGRGYGEENDFCQRAADLGFRHVAAAGAFVEHRESVSFAGDKARLLADNLRLLEGRYPEYAADIRRFLRQDGLRAARWALDRARLVAAGAAGQRFVLVVRNWLGGGTRQAIVDIEARIGYDGAGTLDLCVEEDGLMRLTCGVPRLVAVFAAGEHAALFALLDQVAVGPVLIHQLLGFTAAFTTALQHWSDGRDTRFYLHDFYPLCPRVTLIDAIERFCDAPATEVCARCLELGGAHEASRMTELSPSTHRALFAGMLGAARQVIAPSASAAMYLTRVFPALRPIIEPHPEPPASYHVSRRRGDLHNIVLLGAIGPHKGSNTLRAVAQRARMVAPTLRFHVIGYTAIDQELAAIGNVSVSGAYKPYQLADLVSEADAAIALFLHGWPETFSYTLSEAVQLGLVPLVPAIGAPAERVRAAGFGHVFGFPIDPAEVVDLLASIASGSAALVAEGAEPAAFARSTPPPTAS